MNKILVGNCLLKLKELEDNSVDSIVTDPPYHLVSIVKRFGKEGSAPAKFGTDGAFARASKGFMGKDWDGLGEDGIGIANNPVMWAECLRVLKPGGYLLSFGGTRTYHRMASAIEDAGFEVRDMIEWVYGSGFPKSLNIGKAVDKLQGNEREEVWNDRYKDGKTRQNLGKDHFKMNALNGIANGNITTKGTSKYEGWGTALKPAHEPICMARKPLADGGLDIAKTICYNMKENSLINNSNILWRIKNVKNVGKQKTKQTSSSTEQQKTVEVSVRTVSESENQNLGKRIENLFGKMQEDTEKIIEKSSMKEAEYLTEQTRNESLLTQEHINENEKKKLLLPMEESASAVESQDLSSLPLTTLKVVEENTEKNLNTEISTSFLKRRDTQKTDSDCSVATATSQWVCMDIVRIVKVNFENKEYDFEQLSDGSLIWNDKLKPYREPKPLNVAENCLKWGTGGINIDESRVETSENITIHKGNKFGGIAGTTPETFKTDGQSLGRFPANLILSFAENEYIIRDEITNEQKQKALKWIYENA